MATEAASANGPAVRRCATDEVHLRLLLQDPDYAGNRARIENQAWRAARVPLMARSGCTRIPVVVHVVYRINAEDISKAQIDSQIDVLNQDFRRKNADIGTVPSAFQTAIGDARVEFALATTDPGGAQTDGVTRTKTNVNGFTDDDAVKSTGSGGADPWPADRYLNVWVCLLAGGLLGYAQFPGGPAATDGVVITHTAFGTTGTAAAPFDRGRTATHEIGHWLNLRHIWGDDYGACSGDDFVADTPNQGGPNFGTPSFPTISCANGPNGDMFMNYMDYVYDAAMVMFSAGQVTRMQAALDGPRSTIGTPISCGPKLKFADEPVTLKFRDDIICTRRALDLPIATHPIFDMPGTHPLIDVGGTSPSIDPVKTPGLDKLGGSDIGGGVLPEVSNPAAVGRPAPFILATPHHSRAWEVGQPGGGAYEAQLAQYEELLQQYADAEARGELSEEERRQVHDLHAEYTRLAEQLGGSR